MLQTTMTRSTQCDQQQDNNLHVLLAESCCSMSAAVSYTAEDKTLLHLSRHDACLVVVLILIWEAVSSEVYQLFPEDKGMLWGPFPEINQRFDWVCGPGYVGRNQELAIHLPIVLQRLRK